LLVLLRPLGPLWLALILAVAALFYGRYRVAALWRKQRVQISFGAFCVIMSGVASVAWSVYSGWARGGRGGDPAPSMVEFDPVIESIQWSLQLVAAFPYRDQPAPLPVYVLVLLVLVFLLVAAIRSARGAGRIALLSVVALSVAVPLALTLATMQSIDVIWQGRYMLPFLVGLPLMCGLVLDRSGWAPVERRRLVPLGIAMLGIAQAISVAFVVQDKLNNNPASVDVNWVNLGTWGVAALMLGAWLVLGCWAWQALSLEPEGEGRLQVVTGIGPEGDVSLRRGHARDLVEPVGHDRGDILVVADPN